MAILQVTSSTDRPPAAPVPLVQKSKMLQRCDQIISLITSVLGDEETPSS